jgi:predicted dehydrogenase
MASNLAEAEQMMAAAARAGTKLAVAHQRRFYPGWSEAKRLLAEGAIGRPTHARLEVRDGLLNSATHSIDLMRFVLGDPVARTVTAAVQRSTDRYERGLRMEDSALAMVELGDVRIFVESDLDPEGPVMAKAVITGTDGLLTIQENHVRLFNSDSAGWRTVSGDPFGTAAVAPRPVSPLIAPLYQLVAHFGTAVIDDFAQTFVDQAQSLGDWLDCTIDHHPGDASHGYAVLEILMAIYESARSRQVAHLPLATRVNPLDVMVDSGDLPVTRPGPYDIRARR